MMAYETTAQSVDHYLQQEQQTVTLPDEIRNSVHGYSPACYLVK